MKYSFAALAFAATVLADYPAPAPYPVYESSSVEAPVYPVQTSTYEPVKTYATSTYEPVKTYAPSTYEPVSTYPAKSSAASYPVESSAYPVYPSKNETLAYTTVVYSEYTTYCPEATQVTYAGKTYSVKASSTLVIPCETIIKPIWKPTSTPCPTATAAPYTYVAIPPPAVTSPCTTTLAYQTYPAGVAAPTGGAVAAAPVPYKQANGASVKQIGAMFAGVVAGVVAFAL